MAKKILNKLGFMPIKRFYAPTKGNHGAKVPEYRLFNLMDLGGYYLLEIAWRGRLLLEIKYNKKWLRSYAVKEREERSKDA